MQIPALTDLGSNQARVTVNGVNLYFSYDACIAADGHGCFNLFNPRYRKFSVTTSKHASQMDVKGYPDAEDEADFVRRVEMQITQP